MSNCILLEKNAGISRVWVALDLRCILLTACTNRKHTVLSKGKRELRQIPCQPVAMQQWNTARFKNLSIYLRFGEFFLAIPSYMDVFLCHTNFKPHHGCYFHSLLLQQVPTSWLHDSNALCFPFWFLQDAQMGTVKLGTHLDFLCPNTALQWLKSS